MKKNYELVLKNDESVLIKTNSGKSSYYPYNDIMSYLEVSCQIDHTTLKIQSYKGITEYHYRLLRNESDSLANWQGREQSINYGYASEESIIKAEKMLKSHIKTIKTELETGKNHIAYNAMLSIVKDDLKFYETDFYYHDTLTLARQNPVKFLWFIRPTGTWLITNKSTSSKGIIDYSTTKEKHDIYFFNGKELKLVNEKTDVINLYIQLPKAG